MLQGVDDDLKVQFRREHVTVKLEAVLDTHVYARQAPQLGREDVHDLRYRYVLLLQVRATRYNYIVNLQGIATRCRSLTGVPCRFELYLSTKQHTDEPLPVDNKTGPVAVVRNTRHVLAASPPA